MPVVPQSQPGGTPATLEQSLRVLRIVHGALLVSIVLYVFVILSVGPPAKAIPPMVVSVVAGLAAANAVAAFIFRMRISGPAEEVLTTNPDDATALRRWHNGKIISIAMAEVVALDGLVLKFMGVEWRIAAPFFAAGAILLLIFTPRHP